MDAWYNAKLFSSNQKCAAFKMQLCFLFTAAVDFPLKSKSNKGCSELCNSVQNSWLYQLQEYQEWTHERKERVSLNYKIFQRCHFDTNAFYMSHSFRNYVVIFTLCICKRQKFWCVSIYQSKGQANQSKVHANYLGFSISMQRSTTLLHLIDDGLFS